MRACSSVVRKSGVPYSGLKHPLFLVCPTPCRSAASPPHERFVDVTPISLRRDRPLQRLVRRRSSLGEAARDLNRRTVGWAHFQEKWILDVCPYKAVQSVCVSRSGGTIVNLDFQLFEGVRFDDYVLSIPHLDLRIAELKNGLSGHHAVRVPGIHDSYAQNYVTGSRAGLLIRLPYEIQDVIQKNSIGMNRSGLGSNHAFRGGLVLESKRTDVGAQLAAAHANKVVAIERPLACV